VRARASACPLCRTFLDAVQLKEPSGKELVEAAQMTMYWQEDGFTTSWRGDSQGPYTRYMRLSVPGWSIDGHEFHRVTLLTHKAPTKTRRLFLGRRVPPHINIQRISRWLDNCNRFHDCLATGSTWKWPEFRLIDTWDLCVRDVLDYSEIACGEDSWRRGYLALSYVWGTNPDILKLLKENRSSLEYTGGLRRNWARLPRTIKDTISLTSRLGFRYLW
jgi:hypothetical protein